MIVEDLHGTLHRCTARRAVKDAVCGDWVEWGLTERGDKVVFALEARKNSLTRPDKRGRLLTIAANIDRLVIVLAPSPEPNWEMVDRYLVAACDLGAEAVIVANKQDLSRDQTWSRSELGVYRDLGYRTLAASAHTGKGIDELANALAQGTNILVGQSGVGKSSLVNALLPDLQIRIGVRDFSLIPMAAHRVALGFAEFSRYADACRFPDCRHSVEPGCAVREAMERGEITTRRYKSYLSLLAEQQASP